MDRCSPYSSKTLWQHVPVSPSPVITNTRPKKSTKLHTLHLVRHLLLLKFTLLAVKIQPKCLTRLDVSFKADSSLISLFHLLNVHSHCRTTADLIGREGTAWTYLGLQYKIFPASPKCLGARCSCLANRLLFFTPLFVICCRVKRTSSRNNRFRGSFFPPLTQSLTCNTLSWRSPTSCVKVFQRLHSCDSLSQPWKHSLHDATLNTPNNHQWI